MEHQTITIREKKAAAILRKHPWVFSGAIKHKPKSLKDGDTVGVKSETGAFLGFGHFQNSSISIRMLNFSQTPIDQSYWNEKIENAKAVRESLGLLACPDATNSYRLVHGEGDDLPGLIIDIYDKCAVIQCHSIGMYQSLGPIGRAIAQNYGAQIQTIYHKNVLSDQHEELTFTDQFLLGDQSNGTIVENGCLFEVDWEQGQKTGFFLDQRENRQFLGALAEGKTVLNAFCYTGGFSIYALKGGALQVDSVDISGTAMDLVKRNLEINGFDPTIHRPIKSDVLSYLQTSESYDLVIIDPPAYAKNLKKKHNAIQGYKRLNKMAIEKVTKRGLLATFSCSQVVDEVLFYNTVTAAALEAKRSIRVIKKFTQGPDHPVNLFHPEGAYLKGLLLYVD